MWGGGDGAVRSGAGGGVLVEWCLGDALVAGVRVVEVTRRDTDHRRALGQSGSRCAGNREKSVLQWPESDRIPCYFYNLLMV